MWKYRFVCKLESDVVLNSVNATEGFHQSLDYIPGVKFLGITASKLYDESSEEKTMALFHDGSIRFGNAYPLVDSEKSLPVPFVWATPKNAEEFQDIYIPVTMSKEREKEVLNDKVRGGQLKQVRKGYVSMTSGKIITPKQRFSIKSAYNDEKRKSEDSKMYGYHALPKGTKWVFDVAGSNKELLEEVKQVLQGVHTVGRSRTAQYGLISIDFQEAQQLSSEPVQIKEKQVWVYAESDCAFMDEWGNPTLQPKAEDLGLPKGSKVILEKSQLRNRTYTLWNAKRNTKETQRPVIEKGSVWCCEVNAEVTNEKALSGIGCYLSEGLGDVLYNPSFLEVENGKLIYSFEKQELEKVVEKIGHQESSLVNWVTSLAKKKDEKLSIEQEAAGFVAKYFNNYKGLGKSQWGQVRRMAQQFSKLDDFYKYMFGDAKNPDFGYTKHGVNEHKWREKQRGYILEGAIIDLYKNKEFEGQEVLDFVKYLSAEMAKKEQNV
ncbi:hypothetical protein [Algivirga pacifica]